MDSGLEAVAPGDGKRVRRMRYPGRYNSMLAICSDLDETRSADDYFELVRFLNTREDTSCGKGVGLEIGNTIYFDMPEDQFSYWNCDDEDRARLHALIKSGHIDCIHSFGDLADTRSMANAALCDLKKSGCRIRTWIDHAVAPTNFGPDIMRGFGDVENSQCYHADLTTAYGIQYVWIGRVTSVVGQSVKAAYLDILDRKRLVASAITLCKELAKRILSIKPGSRYSMHQHNELSREYTLRSGQSVSEFMRCNPHPGGVSSGETMAGIPEVLTPGFLGRLVAREAVSIVYTHLGKTGNEATLVPDASRAAFERLAERQRQGEVLVCTTTRLLDYCNFARQLRWQAFAEDDGVTIECTYPDSLDPAGLGFEVSGYSFARLVCNGEEKAVSRQSVADNAQSLDIEVPWEPLQFPSVD